jgi:hypothetical protein
MRRGILGLAAGLFVVAVTAQAPAAIIQVLSRADLGANDFIDWGQLGASGTVVLPAVGGSAPEFPSSGSLSTDDGITVTGFASVRLPGGATAPLAVSQLAGLSSIELGPRNALNTNPAINPAVGITLLFDEPVFAVGADLSAYAGLHTGFENDTITLRMEAFSETGPVIGQIGPFVQSSAFDGFFGFKTDNAVADIFGVRISVGRVAAPIAIGQSRVRLELNRLDILNGSPQDAPVPEPSGLVLWSLFGMVGMGFRRELLRNHRAPQANRR